MMKLHRLQPVEADPNLVAEEERLLKHWSESGIINQYLHKNDHSTNRFSFVDGPITANNPMGVHHAWGRTYKDLWQKYHNLRGFRQRFQNGFDCQGLWIEVEVEKELGFKSKPDIQKYGVAKFVQKCKDRVLKYAAIQTEQSQRLGYFMDWDNSYFTMSDANNYMIWHFLKVCHQHGWLYQGTDSVPWCPRCQTAISQHEILTEDYQEISHQSVYLILPLQNQPHEFLLVWTTTPWTIPANIAVAVDKKLNYSLIQVQGKKLWLATAAVNRVFANQSVTTLTTVTGDKLVGLKYTGPFDNLPAVKKVASHPQFHAVFPTDPLILPITTDEGTGLVHTAVSAGSEDFKLGQKLNLPLIPVITDSADYLPGLGFLSGLNATLHPEIVVDYLKNNNWLLRVENYTHRYPVCWRCKSELVWKVADEWYIAMDKGRPSLRQRMIKVAKKIRWIPDFGLDRELDWLTHMHDWLISKKNRYWGLALPIYPCHRCGQVEVIGSYQELKQKAVVGWEEFAGKSPHKPQIDAVKINCPNCGEVVSRLPDVGNVWLDAGIVPFSTLKYTQDKNYWRQWFPADFITESFPGQFKNWFYSLIAMATVLEDTPSYKTVLGYASVLGEDGRPMHKSLGNAIEFNQAAAKIGVDVMRWLYLRQNPVNNLLFGYTSAAQVRRQVLLILWNSYRFFVNHAATDSWRPVQPDQLPQPDHILDSWILSRFAQTLISVQDRLDDYDAFRATAALEEFIQDLSLWYIRLSRNRVGPTTYQVMHYLFSNLAIVISPLVPFISDRIYTNLTGQPSVHLIAWPQVHSDFINPKLEADMKSARQIVEKIHALRKTANIKVRQPLGQVVLTGVQFNHPQVIDLILQETNIESYQLKSGPVFQVKLDTTLTSQLKLKGQARDLIRQIQQARKTADTGLNEWVTVKLPDWPTQFEAEIKRQTLATKLVRGSSLQIIRNHV